MRKIAPILPLILLVVLLVSCKTTEPIETEVIVVDIPDPEPEPIVVAEPEPDPEPEPEPEPETFEVTEEIYDKTFDDIESIIEKLNEIIKAEKYDLWLAYLTSEYREEMSSTETLGRISDEPVLKKYNIKLRSLKDYFIYVVVPSRSNARLDELVFEDEDTVKAIMVIKETPVILYSLTRRGDTWKIGI